MKSLDNKLFLLLQSVIPEANVLTKKYQNGLCGMIGSNSIFTGGIYFSAMSAMKISADQSHIFAHEGSVIPLKCYSPDIIVHNSFSNSIDLEKLKSESRWLKNFSTLLYGPCLGKEEYVQDILKIFLQESGAFKNIVHIFDADSLHFFNDLALFKTFNDNLKGNIAIFTPNKIEFTRMVQAFLFSKEYIKSDKAIKIISYFQIEVNNFSNEKLYDEFTEASYIKFVESGETFLKIDLYNETSRDVHLQRIYERELIISAIFEDKIIFRKGLIDVITNGRYVYLVSKPGSQKRCGGIGDILGGAISAFTSLYLSKEGINKEAFSNGSFDSSDIKYSNDILYVCALASHYIRLISNECWTKKGISMTASDLLETISLYPIDK